MTQDMPLIRVLVVDDHPLLREGIKAVLAGSHDIQVVGEAGNGHEAIAAYRLLQPDVTLMDLQLPELDGMEAIRAIRADFPQACIAILTTYRGDVRALHAIRAGAQAYLLKSTLRKELTEVIRALAAGERHIPPEIAADVARALGREALSAREVEVLQCVAQGQANKQIGTQLGLSEDTIKGHVRSIMDKLGANNRTHAVSIGIERGIITF
ncbi:response regulator transcription factor [Pigmentiphaga aceris]|uniref:Response regulator transcription factor n=2 Tax=Pigmentiphaga aceris TaxID=1940612 RepID=A0A5C0B7I2_9BURK|nr:response regulator transcription factor [Pigmentiphaga aceris]